MRHSALMGSNSLAYIVNSLDISVQILYKVQLSEADIEVKIIIIQSYS